jgi:hypothetical protein
MKTWKIIDPLSLPRRPRWTIPTFVEELTDRRGNKRDIWRSCPIARGRRYPWAGKKRGGPGGFVPAEAAE